MGLLEKAARRSAERAGQSQENLDSSQKKKYLMERTAI